LLLGQTKSRKVKQIGAKKIIVPISNGGWDDALFFLRIHEFPLGNIPGCIKQEGRLQQVSGVEKLLNNRACY